MDIVQLGPFTVKIIWIIFLLAGAVTYIVLQQVTRVDKAFQQKFLDALVNAVILWFLVFKFSFILFNLTTVIENPISALYFTGGTSGAIVGLILAIGYILVHFRKNKWQIKMFLTAVVYGIVTFVLTFWLMRTLFILIF